MKQSIENRQYLTDKILTQIQKRGLPKLLEGELNAHLGYAKNE